MGFFEILSDWWSALSSTKCQSMSSFWLTHSGESGGQPSLPCGPTGTPTAWDAPAACDALSGPSHLLPRAVKPLIADSFSVIHPAPKQSVAHFLHHCNCPSSPPIASDILLRVRHQSDL